MKKSFFHAALCLCLLAGCGKGSLPPVDIDQAEPALQAALEAWKGGKTQEELVNQTPSILMNEDDWRLGKRLLDYKMEKGALSGRQVRCRVQIKLQDRDGKTVERSAIYMIDTLPRIVIVRDLFAS